MAWQEVLPAPSSKLGSELLDRLVAADVLSAEHAEQLRLAHQGYAADPASISHARITVELEEKTPPSFLPSQYEWDNRLYRPAQVAIAEIMPPAESTANVE